MNLYGSLTTLLYNPKWGTYNDWKDNGYQGWGTFLQLMEKSVQ
ncbi:MAG: hypothetical protein RDV48_28285 [Candidatus Eremiobacteraeota bacterium]|nr:hypothetical protein [Candidatus Eremiobacteraeota bacterium]